VPLKNRIKIHLELRREAKQAIDGIYYGNSNKKDFGATYRII
jgi:hypothetical protein